MINFNKLTDPASFISYYYNELKDKLQSVDLSLSKVGALGYLIHVLGNLQYDIKRYYDGLFKEAFPISATNDVNIQQHANTFGFNYSNATPATLNGTVEFDFLNLPTRANNTAKREIELLDISFTLNALTYNLTSKYKVIIDIINFTEYYKVNIIDTNSFQKTISMTSQNPRAEINGCYQYFSDTTYFNIPNYPFNSFYAIEIDLKDPDILLYSIDVFVKEYDSSVFVKFDALQSKYFSSSSQNIVFYRISYRNNSPIILLELGSGNKGKYIPNSEIRVVINQTKGLLGNIGANIFDQTINGSIQISDYDESGKLLYTLSNSMTPNQFIKFNIDQGVGGLDPLHGEALRDSLIQFIQSRTNLLNELDFRNLLTKYFKYSDFLFKKTGFQDNIISLYISLLDRYALPINTTSKNMLESIFNGFKVLSNNETYIFYPSFDIAGRKFISPFLYHYDQILNIYKANLIIRTQSFSFNNIVKIDNSYLGTEPNLRLTLAVNTDTLKHTFKIISVIDNPLFEYEINIPTLSITSKFNNLKEYEYPNLITNKEDVYINIYVNNILTYRILFSSVGLVTNIEDILHIKKYYLNSNMYLIDVPFVDLESFSLDESYYISKLINQLSSLSLSETRLVSDDIQLKFLNSYLVSSKYLPTLTAQSYDFDISMPFKVRIDLILEKTVILRNSIDPVSNIRTLKLDVAKYLNEKTGSIIKFYGSQLVDFIHNNNTWIKQTSVTLLDSNNIEIPFSNIESIEQKQLISKLNKDDLLDYCPILWWFDINNITINFTYVGD